MLALQPRCADHAALPSPWAAQQKRNSGRQPRGISGKCLQLGKLTMTAPPVMTRAQGQMSSGRRWCSSAA